MKRFLPILLLSLLLVGCTQAPTSTPQLGASQPSTQGDHNHPQPSRPIASHPASTPGTSAPTEPTKPQPVPKEFLVYIPNETADGFDIENATINDLHYDAIILLLQLRNVLQPEVAVNSCQKEGTQLHLDMNQAFLDQLLTTGSSGEKMLIGSIVNTFLSAFDCETVLLTVNGHPFSSGHADYDHPLQFVP